MRLQIENLVNDNNNHAVNQFVVKLNGNVFYQSYDTVIAKKDKEGKITLCSDWGCSKTTRKHLYIWLRDNTSFRYVENEKDVIDAINNGLIKVVSTLKY